MLKAILFYSSQNGSTALVADRAARALSDSGWIAEAVDVKSFRTAPVPTGPDVSGYDLAGFLCPTHVSRPSFVMTDFIRTVRDLAGKPAFTIVTYGTEIGDGSNLLRKAVARAGGRDVGALTVPSRNPFPGYVSRGRVFRPREPNEESLSAIRPFMMKAATRAVEGGPYGSDPFDPKPKAVYRFERFALNRTLVRGLYSRFMEFNGRKCTACGTCEANCPTGAISADEKGRRRAGSSCALCLKCEISCPSGAVRSPVHWLVFKPFLAYNVRAAARKGIPSEAPA
jgi:ferredoxin